VGVGTGVAMGLRANSLGDDAASNCVGDAPLLCNERALSDAEAQATSALVSDLSFGLAGAAAIGVVLTYVLGGDAESDAEGTAGRVSPFSVNGGGGLVWSIRR